MLPVADENRKWGGKVMAGKTSEISDQEETSAERDLIGPAAFIVFTVAVLIFFWWLLIYDHGVVSMH